MLTNDRPGLAPGNMVLYTQLFVRRSDGVMEVISRDGKTERNEPLPEQLDRTPDAKGDVNYCREIHPEEMKHLDWRRKLACMLMEKLGNEEQKGLLGLSHFACEIRAKFCRKTIYLTFISRKLPTLRACNYQVKDPRCRWEAPEE